MNGGRLAITTDTWSARNYSDITPAIFTVTRDNASTNTTMLLEYKKLASTNPISLKQPWAFIAKAGDVRCIGHIINIAVQAALASLKATPDERVEAYRLEIGAARIPLVAENDIVTVLAKLQRHIYMFRNRCGWKDALKNQCKAASIKVRQLTLDMPLQVPITALCVSQQLDTSMRDIALTTVDWATLHDLLKLFYIFIRPTEKLQGSSYPTLNYAVPQYMQMIKKLEDIRSELPERSPIANATLIALKKLNDYYTLATNQQQSHSTIATICRESDIRAANVINSIEDEDLDTEQAMNIDVDSEDELYISQSHYNTEPEWKRWMKEPTVGRDTDILKYWQSKQYQYPLIACIAKDHLAIPATSADSERVFSVGGDIITKKRNRLSPSTLRYLLCLRNWGVISQGDDEDSGDDADNES
ncbi:hypothetical protein V500_04432 [Pseudogymnoascus sp. VKM F-4518 (FW-2643)]|nr:hypothetical protein V500_04432 [Pseudogymnoascus sp. VKM F-4518 (FW-2643)]